MFEMIGITDQQVESVAEAEPELTPSGRLRRGAAKRLVNIQILCIRVSNLSIWFLVAPAADAQQSDLSSHFVSGRVHFT